MSPGRWLQVRGPPLCWVQMLRRFGAQAGWIVRLQVLGSGK